MLISPPFLPARVDPQVDDAWLALAMSGGDQLGDGFFPLGDRGVWHGGLHLTAPVNPAGNGLAPVCAIANGTVAYRRVPEKSSTSHALNYHGSSSDLQWTDNGVVVLRHVLEIGADDLAAVVIYSVYMHLARLDAALPEVGHEILRMAPVGQAGQIAGAAGQIHFEIIVANEQIASLCGRQQQLTSTSAAGRGTILGTVYARLPAGTEWKTQVTFSDTDTAGSASETAAHNSTDTLFAGLSYQNAACVITLYKENGDAVGTRTEPQGQYTLYDTSAARYPLSKLAGYELMRYGRTVGTAQALVPTNAAHWRELPYPNGGTGWVNLNATGILWYSDADFPHWRGWQLVQDDTDGDSRCDSPTISQIRAGDRPTAVPTLMAAPAGDVAKLKKLVCLFPTEWDEDDGVIEQRYAWFKTLPNAYPALPESFDKFKGYIKALGFWRAAALQQIDGVHWHLNPRALIGLLRGAGLWADLANRWQTACANHALPDVTGLSTYAKTCLYDYALRSSKGAARNHAEVNDTAALAALDAGRPTIFGMRVASDVNANQGRGLWDDRLAVLKKEATGLTVLVHSSAFTAEPSGKYLDGGQYKNSTHGSNVNAGGTAHFDSGRLSADRTYEYQPAFSPGFGPNMAGTNYNILRKTQASFVDRLVTTTSTLPNGTYVSNTNTHWITGSSASFSEQRTMHFHRGYNGMTGSAGCQTFPVAAGETFMDFSQSLRPITADSRYQYVLNGM